MSDACKQKLSSIKTKKLWKLPQILIIFLKRFDYNLKKNNKPINIIEHINFNRWCIIMTLISYPVWLVISAEILQMVIICLLVNIMKNGSRLTIYHVIL